MRLSRPHVLLGPPPHYCDIISGLKLLMNEAVAVNGVRNACLYYCTERASLVVQRAGGSASEPVKFGSMVRGENRHTAAVGC